MSRKDILFDKQNRALRNPAEIFGVSFDTAGITNDTLKFKADKVFIKLLKKLGITLIISREYENLLLALNSRDGKSIRQTFFHVPHPSGLAADRRRNRLFVAATRNPNQIIEFTLTSANLERKHVNPPETSVLVPRRGKYFPGQYYFHDLALLKNRLYANSVGMNCVVEIDMNSTAIDKPLWWPKCIEQKGQPNFKANYLQLNSIALGSSLEESYFSASAKQIGARRPGQLNFPVDGRGVIFSGKTREPAFGGLTRPHSARLHKKKLWVANSGYGQVGYYDKGAFVPAFSFDGWTRGLCFIEDILFVGVSRVLPRFRHYAPGITVNRQTCAVVAVDTVREKIIGKIDFPFGNQIFAIEYFDRSACAGFPFKFIKKNDQERDIFAVSL